MRFAVPYLVAIMLCAPSNAMVERPPGPVLVSMLTYNVEGLPWPVATGRPRALARIASGLAALRRDGHQPHLVMLPEAFVPEAKAIGRTAGYRYVAFGPGAAGPMTPDDRAYQRQIDAFDRFVADEVRSGAPVPIAGDFKVGRSPSRRSYFSGRILGDATAVGLPGSDAARRADDVASSLARGKDWPIFRSSPGVSVAPVALSAPIGRDADGAMLSDHLSLAVTYRLSSADRTAAAVRIASR